MTKRVTGRHTAFLKAFAITGSIGKAARAAKVARSAHYDWLRDRKGYAEDFAKAAEQAAQVLEDEAVRRALEGCYEPNTYKGNFVYPVRGYEKNEDGTFTHDVRGCKIPIYGKKPLGMLQYSDSLLQFLLKGLRPDRYRDRVSAELTGKDGAPIAMEDKRLSTLTDDELTQLLALARKLTPSGTDRAGTPEAPKK